MTIPASPLHRESSDDDRIWTLRLDTPPGNIIDQAMIEALTQAFLDARHLPQLETIIITGAGKHFSFGASVPEHSPEQVSDMLPKFHELFRTMLDTPVPTIAAVTGQCLGGGMELATFCDRIFAHPQTSFAQAEIRLGVFAPVATAHLAHRIGCAAATDLCLTGRAIEGDEALRLGLADELADDPLCAAISYVQKYFHRHSASSLRIATKALRSRYKTAFLTTLQSCERIYLDELMQTRDAVEGIEAFMAKRRPTWSNQ